VSFDGKNATLTGRDAGLAPVVLQSSTDKLVGLEAVALTMKGFHPRALPLTGRSAASTRAPVSSTLRLDRDIIDYQLGLGIATRSVSS
jgi:hypothetical protein